MNRRRFVAAAGSGTALALAGCLGIGASVNDPDVGMSIDSFRPEDLTVEAGTAVTFGNTSSHSHTVTAFQDSYPEGASFWSSGDFDSETEAIDAWEDRQGGKLSPGDTYERTFEIPGRYEYYCIPHIEADMTGVITVEP